MIKADTGLRVTGTVTKGQSLRLLASKWTALDGTSSFAPTLQLTGEDAVNNQGLIKQLWQVIVQSYYGRQLTMLILM